MLSNENTFLHDVNTAEYFDSNYTNDDGDKQYEQDNNIKQDDSTQLSPSSTTIWVWTTRTNISTMALCMGTYIS